MLASSHFHSFSAHFVVISNGRRRYEREEFGCARLVRVYAGGAASAARRTRRRDATAVPQPARSGRPRIARRSDRQSAAQTGHPTRSQGGGIGRDDRHVKKMTIVAHTPSYMSRTSKDPTRDEGRETGGNKLASEEDMKFVVQLSLFSFIMMMMMTMISGVLYFCIWLSLEALQHWLYDQWINGSIVVIAWHVVVVVVSFTPIFFYISN